MTWQPELDFGGHSRPTQAARILAWLESGRSITPLEALDRFGCFRLGARILELRRQGHAIASRMVVATAEGKRVAQYWLQR